MKAAGLGVWDWKLHSGQMDWSGSIETIFGFLPDSIPNAY
jgi:hypothetical protein